MNLTKQYENYYVINKRSVIKSTMTLNQNCLKANNVFTINSVVWKKYIYCFQVNTGYILKLKKYSFAYCPRHYYFLLLPSTKIWIANAAHGNEKVVDPWLIQISCNWAVVVTRSTKWANGSVASLGIQIKCGRVNNYPHIGFFSRYQGDISFQVDGVRLCRCLVH
jgi:hypothetical protein